MPRRIDPESTTAPARRVGGPRPLRRFVIAFLARDDRGRHSEHRTLAETTKEFRPNSSLAKTVDPVIGPVREGQTKMHVFLAGADARWCQACFAFSLFGTGEPDAGRHHLPAGKQERDDRRSAVRVNAAPEHGCRSGRDDRGGTSRLRAGFSAAGPHVYAPRIPETVCLCTAVSGSNSLPRPVELPQLNDIPGSEDTPTGLNSVQCSPRDDVHRRGRRASAA